MIFFNVADQSLLSNEYFAANAGRQFLLFCYKFWQVHEGKTVFVRINSFRHLSLFEFLANRYERKLLCVLLRTVAVHRVMMRRSTWVGQIHEFLEFQLLMSQKGNVKGWVFFLFPSFGGRVKHPLSICKLPIIIMQGDQIERVV